MKIAVSGYYGFNNTGDEAVLDSIISKLREKDPGIHITVFSSDPRATSSRFSVDSVNRLDPFSVIRALMKSDVLVSGGGGLFQDSTGRFSVAYYLSIIFLAKILGKKAVVFGQGYGPVKRPLNKKLIRYVLNMADLITLRDIASKQMIKKDGVNIPPVLVCADPAMLLEKGNFSDIVKDEMINEFDRPTIGISLRNFKGMPASFSSDMARAIDSIIDKHDINAIFIPFQVPEDTEMCVNVLSFMKNKGRVIAGLYGPRQVLGLVSSLDMMIGVRLHSLIFASASGVPAIAISYDPKVRAFASDAGFPCVDPDVTEESFISTFDEVWTNRERKAREFKDKSRLLRYKALINFESFFEYFGMQNIVNLFGVRIDNVDLQRGLEKVDEYIKSGKPHLIFTPNPEIIMSSQKDDKMRGLLNSSDLNIPDGIGIVAAARLIGTPVRGRLTGIDFMMSILDTAREKSYKVFLLGSAPGVAANAAKNIPGVEIVGACDGYFRDEDSKEIISLIKKAHPDILFVGLGSPRQEQWISEHYKEIGAPVNMVIGGSLDVLSGKAKRAPVLFQKTGLEWLYRLSKEPKRWKRQLNLARFGWLAIRHKLRIY